SRVRPACRCAGIALLPLVLGRHHQLTACGAREAIRAVHVFDGSGRMHEGARRHRAHEIGYARGRDRRGVAVLAVVLTAAASAARAEEIEGGNETVVAKIEVVRPDGGFEPAEGFDVA